MHPLALLAVQIETIVDRLFDPEDTLSVFPISYCLEQLKLLKAREQLKGMLSLSWMGDEGTCTVVVPVLCTL